MSRTADMTAAARRNLDAANALPEVSYHVAGYLYGLAAECAVKAIMQEIGLKEPETRNGPYYEHFPRLLSMVRDLASGHGSAKLRRVVEQKGFMHEWHTDIRYAASGQVDKAAVLRWQDQAHVAVQNIGT